MQQAVLTPAATRLPRGATPPRSPWKGDESAEGLRRGPLDLDALSLVPDPAGGAGDAAEGGIPDWGRPPDPRPFRFPSFSVHGPWGLAAFLGY